MRAAWTASGACTSGSTGRREGETRRAAPTTRSTGSAVTTSTTTQTGPANNQTRVVGPAAYNHPDHPYLDGLHHEGRRRITQVTSSQPHKVSDRHALPGHGAGRVRPKTKMIRRPLCLWRNPQPGRLPPQAPPWAAAVVASA